MKQMKAFGTKHKSAMENNGANSNPSQPTWFSRMSGLWNTMTSGLRPNSSGGGANQRKGGVKPDRGGVSNTLGRTSQSRGGGSIFKSKTLKPKSKPFSLEEKCDLQSDVSDTTKLLEDSEKIGHDDLILSLVDESSGALHQVWINPLESLVVAKYIGSFSVVGEDQNDRSEYVRSQLTEMREVQRSKTVLLVISLSGIKVCSSSGESVYMAHALKRISYATCDPDNKQFSFLAREPKGHTSIQYCHAFVTSTPEQAEELNNIVGNAFKMAYAYQRQSEHQLQHPSQQQPTFHEIIEQQLEEQRSKMELIQEERQKELEEKLKLISTPTVNDRVKERKERRKEELEQLERERIEALLQNRDRTKWAKQVAVKSKHKTPFSEELQRHSMYAGATPTVKPTNGSTPPAAATLRPSPASLSMSALKEAFENSDNRSHGSPVMAMKETIDMHFNGSLSRVNDQGGGGGDSVDGYLCPVVSTDPQPADDEDDETSQQNSNMVNRPLPTLPLSEEKKQRKAKARKSAECTPSRKSEEPGGSRNSSPIENYRNGQGTLYTVRPPSVQYQNNDNLHHNPLDVVGVYAGPLTPKKYDSLRKLDPNGHLEDEEQLRQHTWYQAGIPREIALEILLQQEIGSFIVRDSTTHPGCYALSVKVPKFENPAGISHYLIHRTPSGGVKLKGLDKEWPNLMALVVHHTVMPEMLACTLRLPRNSNNPTFNEIERDEKEEDEDYQKLSDFSTMMAELKKV